MLDILDRFHLERLFGFDLDPEFLSQRLQQYEVTQ